MIERLRREKNEINTPQYAESLVMKFRNELIDYERKRRSRKMQKNYCGIGQKLVAIKMNWSVNAESLSSV